MIVEPSGLGVELFLHAMGLGHLEHDGLFKTGVTIAAIEGINIQPDYLAVKN
jgi:hypothetical protein